MEKMICPNCFSATLRQTRQLNMCKCGDCKGIFILRMRVLQDAPKA